MISCYTIKADLNDDAPQELYFKKAQELADYHDYGSAIKVYELFIEKFPGDPNIDSAHYEIGYLYYKSKNYSKAEEIFNELITRSTTSPSWIPVLSQKILNIIKTGSS